MVHENELKNIKSKDAVVQKAQGIASLNKLKQYVEYLTSSDEDIAFKASWVLSHARDQQNKLLDVVLDDLIPIWKSTPFVGVKRNVIRVLSFSKLTDEQLGLLMDDCFAVVANPNETVAVRMFSLEVLLQAYHKYPELGHEIKEVCKIALIDASSGVKHKCTKAIRLIGSAF